MGVKCHVTENLTVKILKSLCRRETTRPDITFRYHSNLKVHISS